MTLQDWHEITPESNDVNPNITSQGRVVLNGANVAGEGQFAKSVNILECEA